MIKYIVTDIKKLYVFTFLVVFSTCLAFSFDSSARNLLLVGFMALASLSIVFYRQVQKSDFLLLLFVFCLFFFPVFAHDFETRWSTVIYSCLFCMSFIAFVRAFHVAQFSQLDFLNTLRFLLYAYCIVLIIQQISVIVGLPPINLRNYNPAEPFKLNALGAEPSWSARIMALLFYCYITVKEYVLNRQYNFKENIKEDKWIWFAFLWSIITMISGTAMIFLAFVLLKFIRIKKVLSIIPLFFILFVVAESSHFEPYERMKNTTLATLTLDEQKIVEADHSASFRILPIIGLAKAVDISSFEGLFGHGVDSVNRNLTLVVGAESSSSTFLGVWYELGFIAFLLFMVFSLRLCIDIRSPVSFVFWFMLVFMYSLNVQIPWLAIMLLYMTKHYSKQSLQ